MGAEGREAVNQPLTVAGRGKSDSAEYLAFVRRALRGYSRRVAAGDTDDLADLAVLRDTVEDMIRDTVRELHYGAAGLSWSQVGAALGTTRQAAQQRYGRPGVEL